VTKHDTGRAGRSRRWRIPAGLMVLWTVAAFLLGAGVHRDRTARAAVPAAVPAAAPAQEAALPQAQPRDMQQPLPPVAPAPADAPAELAPVPPDRAAAGQAVRQARADVDTPIHQRLVSILGLGVLLLIAWALSVDRRGVPVRLIAWGLGLQFVFALFILRTRAGEAIFATVNDVIVSLLGFTIEGARFLFGNLVWNNVPVGLGAPGNAPIAADPVMVAGTGAFFAFNVLPTIIFFSSLMTLLYHLGVMQLAVKGVAWVMMRTLRTSGAETLSAAGNIFVGQTEAPLMIKPFVARMTMSELMAVMTAGFATVAGGVMAAYVGMLVAFFPDIAGHLLAASVMSAPAALVIAKIMYPEREEPVTRGSLRVEVESPDANVIDAAARGAGEGLTLALNVGAMLLAFIALVALFNALLGYLADVSRLALLLQNAGVLADGQRLTLELLLGWMLAPLAWVMGVPWQDAATIGSLMGVKTVLNEFVAYLQLSSILSGGTELSPRSIIIATYALAGFANFSSIAIQIGGIGGIAPSRRSDLSRIGLRAMIGGTLAAFMTATVAGILV
jgi:concentrative nucleoside transporter, CNT family